jgi:hypothetical protein
MVAHPKEHQVQHLEMYTGEGKTFTIAMAATWRALRGEEVMIHTDKHSNVDQSYRSMVGLYKFFGVECGIAIDHEQTTADRYRQYLLRSKEYAKFKAATPEQRRTMKPKSRVRYGVWSQFMHEEQEIKMLISAYEHMLVGRTDFQKKEKVELSDDVRRERELELEWFRKLLQVDAVMADEGDDYIDLEDSDVTRDETDFRPYSDHSSVFLLHWVLILRKLKRDIRSSVSTQLKVRTTKSQVTYRLDSEHSSTLIRSMQQHSRRWQQIQRRSSCSCKHTLAVKTYSPIAYLRMLK